MTSTQPLRNRKRELTAVIFGQGFTALGAFVGVRLLTEFLSPEIFGQYKLALASLSLLTGLLIRPFLQYIMRAYHDVKGDENRALFTETIRAFVLKYAAVLGLALSISIIFFADSFQATAIDIGLVATLFMLQSLLAFERSAAITRAEQATAGVIGASISWLVPGGIVLLSIASKNLTSVLLANTLVLLTIYALVRVWLRQGVHANRSSRLKTGVASLHIRPAFTYGWPLVAVGLLSWTTHESDRFFLSYFQSNHSVGIYTAAYGLVATPFTMMVGMAAQFLYPIVFESAAKGDMKKEHNVLKFMLWLSSLLCVVGISFIWLFQSQIAYLALGAEYREEAVDLFVWLAAGYGFLGVAMSYDLVAYGAKKTTHIMTAYFFSAVFNIILNLWLIPIFSAKGAAISTMVSLLSYLIVMATLHYISTKDNSEKSESLES